jgi:hypothetical protein
VDGDSAERELNAFVSRRSKGREEANRAEESWKAPTRRRQQQRQRENAEAWARYYQALARTHHDLAAKAAAKADDIIERLELEGAA